ncbi:Nucleotidase YfbR, HD superfamily protein [Minicystis rosea]|nr:Nucleotidase YfbR, HD superfamily protein [Minicystis rosea]
MVMKTKAESPLPHLDGKGASRLVELYFAVSHLKQLFRQGWLRAGISEARCESVAEHSFSVALLALFVAEDRFPDLDAGKAVKMALLHDLAEAFAGDTTPHDGVSREEKERRERDAMSRLFTGVPGAERYLALWEEYESQSSREALLVKQMDRLEMALQGCVYEHQLGLDLGQFFTSARGAMIWDEVKAILDEVESARPR